MKITKIEKRRIFERVADSIEAEIRLKGWNGLLPSGRDLANEHGVSLPTVQKAISILVKRKVLVSRGGKRRPEVAPGVSKSHRTPLVHQVLIITQLSMQVMRPPMSGALLLLQESMRAEGHGCEIVDLAEFQGAELRKRSHAAVTQYRPSHCIMVQPTREVFAVIARSSAKLATLSGMLRTKRVKRLGHQYGPMIEKAVQELKALGHHRLFIPFLGRKIKMKDSAASIRLIAQEQAVSVNVRFSAEELSHENMEQCLDVARRRGATAVIFPQWGDFLYATTYFAKKGLEIPRDISVVILVGHLEARIFAPPLAGFLVYPPQVLTEHTRHWIEHDSIERNIIEGALVRSWFAGGSIGPAPKPMTEG
jgi:DNA-binding transcriptional regulator YhcF (GntR family)